MPCSTRMRREECALRLRSCTSSYQCRSILLELAVRRRHDASASLRSESLVAGIGRDLDCRTFDQELDQSRLSGGVGDVRAASGSGRAAEQQPPLLVGEDHGLHCVLLVLARDELVPVLATYGRAADPDLGAVDDAGLLGLIDYSGG
ncbi:hypothetical protein IX27_02585 [Streptomyces sp. JS01]|nr:hypothetical protein IX27_02585 [Streptomyces sp. JS01]